MRKFSLLFIILLALASGFANAPKNSKVLIVLDASGSMMGKWGNNTKWDIAKRVLSTTIDSIQTANPSVQFGVRIFGHQFHRTAENCTDSNFEIPFAKKNARDIMEKLSYITPQGQTPIAHSLVASAADFVNPKDLNSIILITDGLETCEGDPCDAAIELQKMRVSMKPFVIGMGLQEAGGFDFYNCVGFYYEAADEKSMSTALDVVVSQALNNTTTQVNLIDDNGKPLETNVEMTFTDAYSGKDVYNCLHTMTTNAVPDTIPLDPKGKYNLTVHTIPPVYKKDIELLPGKHNIIPVNAGQGTLSLISPDSKVIPCIIRQNDDQKTLEVQNFNTDRRYLTGTYNIEVLTLPRLKFNDVKINQYETTKIQIDRLGRLTIYASELKSVSIYTVNDGVWEMIKSFPSVGEKTNLDLLPGEYKLVYRSNIFKISHLTETIPVKINSGKTTNINL